MAKPKKTIQVKTSSLWEQEAKSFSIDEYAGSVADTEKLLVFAETGAGKTSFYLGILQYLWEKGIPKEKVAMYIIFPDRPSGLKKLYGLIPKEYRSCTSEDYWGVHVYPVTDYESMIKATATAEKKLENHYKEVGEYGWLVFELMENYWTFSQDYYCRQAYGQTMGEYFAQMQSIVSKSKAEKKTAYEAFAGPFGGPWPIIKFFHNFNWIDRVKRFPYNTFFTSEIKEEQNKDSIFYELGYRPAGEKHNQHKMDTILYLTHKKGKFTIKPLKLTGYKKMYGELDITNRNGYKRHREACKKLEELGHSVTKFEDLEAEAGVEPPKKKKATPEKKEKPKEEETEELDVDF